MKMNTDFESHFIKNISVSNFSLVYLLPFYFRFWPTCSEIWSENSKMFLFLFINIIYGLLNTTEIQNRLFKTLFYPENIWVLKNRYLKLLSISIQQLKQHDLNNMNYYIWIIKYNGDTIDYLRHYYIQKYFSFEKEILEITLNLYSTTWTRKLTIQEP